MYGRNKGVLSIISPYAQFKQAPARTFRPMDTRSLARRVWDWLVE